MIIVVTNKKNLIHKLFRFRKRKRGSIKDLARSQNRKKLRRGREQIKLVINVRLA